MSVVEGYFKAASDFRNGSRAKRIIGREGLLVQAIYGHGRVQELAQQALSAEATVQPPKNHKRAGA